MLRHAILAAVLAACAPSTFPYEIANGDAPMYPAASGGKRRGFSRYPRRSGTERKRMAKNFARVAGRRMRRGR